VAGLLLLALGITLNTKAGLGVSPIISISYSISQISNSNFGNVTFILYSTFVLIEVILHIIISRRKKRANAKYCLKQVIMMDILQLPLSLIFTRFMNLFSGFFPDLSTDCPGTFQGSIIGRVIILLIAIVLTGIGAVLSLDMRIIPNPGDGIVQAISDFCGKKVGFVKNCFDLFNVCFTSTICMISLGHIVGIGIGTVLAVVGVGRVMAFFNHFCLTKITKMAGISQ
jgi:uncharacterized membrane protein YczE